MEMNTLEILRTMEPTFLDKARVKGYVCPVCSNGTGKTGDGLIFDKKNSTMLHKKYKCFKCNLYADVVDLYGIYMGIDNTREKIDSAKEYFGITENNNYFLQEPKNIKQETKNYMEFYKECLKRNDFKYLLSRGISKNIQEKFCVGLFNDKYGRERCIIPHSENDYLMRATDNNNQYSKMHTGSKSLFNINTLENNDVVVIVEGEIDALSVEEIGFASIGLGSTSEASLFVKYLKDNDIKNKKFILMLDNDEAGIKATKILEDGLSKIKLKYLTATYETKDPNEFLIKDRDEFRKTISFLVEDIKNTKKDNTSSYLNSMDFFKDIEKQKAVKTTGFTELDKLSGGLYTGLYVIGATSSLGKTTFTLQLADNLAMSGENIIFFSLEQSKLELVTKSLSRTMIQKNKDTAITSLEIRKGIKTDALKDAIKEYTTNVADRMNIVEGNFDCNISFIGRYVRNYIDENNCRPVVVLDYLQILNNENIKLTDKEKIDRNVTELKRLSRDLNITIIVISSVNRANYLTPIDFESFKESGGIEYTADVIWGLQLSCLNDELFSKQNNLKEKRDRIKEAKSATPRKIELVCLKNRFGIANFKCNFDYYAKNDLYEQNVDGDFNRYYGHDIFKEDKKVRRRG